MPLNVENAKQYNGINNHMKQGFEEVFNVYNNEQKVTNQVCNIIEVFLCVISQSTVLLIMLRNTLICIYQETTKSPIERQPHSNPTKPDPQKWNEMSITVKDSIEIFTDDDFYG